MGDHYIALVDPNATESDAVSRADTVRNALILERIILPKSSSDCVLNGEGYPPGPRLNDCYTFREATAHQPPELRYWEMLRTIGVQFHTERWVNFFGFPQFEDVICPTCNQKFDEDSEILDPIYDLVGAFINDRSNAMLECPNCRTDTMIQEWDAKPHLGFCNLAIQFWNWPPFDSDGWKLSVPEIVNRALGNSTVATYGKI